MLIEEVETIMCFRLVHVISIDKGGGIDCFDVGVADDLLEFRQCFLEIFFRDIGRENPFSSLMIACMGSIGCARRGSFPVEIQGFFDFGADCCNWILHSGSSWKRHLHNLFVWIVGRRILFEGFVYIVSERDHMCPSGEVRWGRGTAGGEGDDRLVVGRDNNASVSSMGDLGSVDGSGDTPKGWLDDWMRMG